MMDGNNGKILKDLKSMLTELHGKQLLDAVLLLEMRLTENGDDVYHLVSVLAAKLCEAIVYDSEVLKETELVVEALEEIDSLECKFI